MDTINILLTGGLGYIGSHICVELDHIKYNVVIVDNLSNSKVDIKDKIEHIINKHITVFHYDLLDREQIDTLFQKYKFDTIIHCAGLKAVSESIKEPLKYYQNNVIGTINLLDIMQIYNCKKIIFSSSAIVYGNQTYPVDEKAETGRYLLNPYGRSKYFIEEILKDICLMNKEFVVVSLRYFNPIGSHPSGLLIENPNDIPNNLFPHILRGKVDIFGNDYKTKDGTCIRDYIHVMDLAKAHIAVLQYIKPGFNVYNLGTGKGITVLELIQTFEKVNKKKIEYKIIERREGDLETVYSMVDKAKNELGWISNKTLEDMVKETI